MRRTGVVVADSLPLFRTGVRRLLERESDFEVEEAGTQDELLAVAQAVRPEIALVDLDLDPGGAVAAVGALAAESNARAIVWSLDPSCDTVLGAIRAGASGYLDRRITGDGLLRSLRGLAHGEAPISRVLVTQMIDALHGLDRRERARAQAATLSFREREVLELVAGGARNREIAERLLISEFTVKRHVQNILDKLDLPSRHAAAALHGTAFAETGAVAS